MTADRRNSFRSPLPENERDAVLETAAGKVPVRVLDESAGGFAVTTDRAIEIQQSDIARLRFSDRLIEVRVARMKKVGAGAKLGLQRTQDLEYVDFGTRRSLWFDPRVAWRTRGGKAAVISIGLLLVAGLTSLLFQLSKPGSGIRHGLAAVLPIHAGEPTINRGPSIPLPPLRMTKELRQAIGDHPGLEVFGLTEVAEQLALTAEQREKIRQLADSAAPPAESEVATSSASDPQKAYRAYCDALAALNSDQQVRLKSLLERATSATARVRELAKRNWPKANTRQLVERLGGAALTLPQVAKQLKLSTEQQGQIESLLEIAFDASDELIQQAKAASNAEDLSKQASAILEDARKQAMELLTSEQADRLRSLAP